MIRAKETKLPGVLEIRTEQFIDHRGTFWESYNKADYEAAGITTEFVQDDFSYSQRDVLRGIHVEPEIDKLLSCPLGILLVVIVDCQSGQWQGFVLSQENRRQLFVPAGYGVGHVVWSESGILHYKKSGYYSPDTQLTYRYDDPKFGINWGTRTPILSRRDVQCESV